MSPELLKSYLYPALAGAVAAALIVDALFFSKDPERIALALAILAPGVVGRSK